MPISVRTFASTDETSWLRCRLLAFFDSSYFDDVHTRKTVFTTASIELVAVADGDLVVGILDIELDGELATIDCIAVHPEFRGQGIATALLAEGRRRLSETAVTTLDAWTRDDEAANGWYRAMGFGVEYRYLHVYLDEGDPPDGFATPDGMSLPVKAFMHATFENETEFRSRFTRVHECRRYVLHDPREPG